LSRAEKIKEQIGWLKVAFGLLTAVIVSLVGYIATSYKIAEPIMLIVALLLTVLLSFGVIVVNKKAFDKMDELEEL
jgi:F0F1-type ATP synthase assembly protein I